MKFSSPWGSLPPTTTLTSFWGLEKNRTRDHGKSRAVHIVTFFRPQRSPAAEVEQEIEQGESIPPETHDTAMPIELVIVDGGIFCTKAIVFQILQQRLSKEKLHLQRHSDAN